MRRCFSLSFPFSSPPLLDETLIRNRLQCSPYLDLTLTLIYRCSVETSYTIIKELAKVACLCPLVKDQLSEFISSPHSCSVTRTQDHHGNQPVVAESIAVFYKAVRERVLAPRVKWSGSKKHLVGSESSNALLLGHSQHVQWSYVTLTGSELPAQVCEILLDQVLLYSKSSGESFLVVC